LLGDEEHNSLVKKNQVGIIIELEDDTNIPQSEKQCKKNKTK